jgi:hypothetical protein
MIRTDKRRERSVVVQKGQLSPLFSDAHFISSLFCSSFSLGTVKKKKKKKKKIKSESETRPLDSSEFHDDEFVFSIIVVLVGVILGVRGILRASLRGENQPPVCDFPVGDAGGVESVDAVGETIRHAMRVFTLK